MKHLGVLFLSSHFQRADFAVKPFAEAWVNIDVLGLLQQTGVIPMPG